MSKKSALSVELDTYEQNLPELLADIGKYVVINETKIVGVYDTYEDAIKVGYSQFGLEPFLVKQVSPAERILSFTRNYEFACRA